VDDEPDLESVLMLITAYFVPVSIQKTLLCTYWRDTQRADRESRWFSSLDLNECLHN